MKILIVDDEPVNRELLKAMLHAYGELEFAENGKKAFNMFKEGHRQAQPYDVIFMDILMPEWDGHSALKKIREWEEGNIEYGKEVKVIIVSAASPKAHVFPSFREGCESYLIKPINKKLVVAKLEELGLIEN